MKLTRENYNMMRGYAQTIENKVNQVAVEQYGIDTENYHWSTEVTSFDSFFRLYFYAGTKCDQLLKEHGLSVDSVVITRVIGDYTKESCDDMIESILNEVNLKMSIFLNEVEAAFAKYKELEHADMD